MQSSSDRGPDRPACSLTAKSGSHDLRVAITVPSKKHPQRGLECVINRWRFGVPVEFVQQVVDLEVGSPPPLAKPWVGGVGMYEGRPLVLVSLFPAPGPARRRAKGIWLAAEGSATGYVLEVTRVEAFVEAKVQQQAVLAGKDKLPGFVMSAVTSSSQSIGWIHVGSMLRALAGGA